jgi:isocitrate lyase
MSAERARFAQEVTEVKQWWKVCPLLHAPDHLPSHRHRQSPRFLQTKRPYTAADVVSKRGTIRIDYPSNIQAKKLWAILGEHAKRGTPSHTYGA